LNPGANPPILRTTMNGVGVARTMTKKCLVALGAVTVALASACGASHTVKTEGDTGMTTATTAARTTTSKTPVSEAKVGTRIALAGNDNGEKMTVTVTKVVPTARGANEFETPSGGHRFYAVQFRLINTGTAAYSDSPSNGAAVVDSKGQSYDSTFGEVRGCHAFPAQENIAPGNSGLGCVVFEVPKGAKIKGVQFTLDSGFGPDTGQWSVG
jgi:Domain of unknown function (DUF4352)